MATFERYFLDDKQTHKEVSDAYFKLAYTREMADRILEEFEITDKDAVIVNGHIPVKIKKGESPIKVDGKLLIIDGGLSKAYQSVTGIAGYTLIYSSRGMTLVSHERFDGIEAAIKENKDILSTPVCLSAQPTAAGWRTPISELASADDP